jgi:two-component sensor histidine kinase
VIRPQKQGFGSRLTERGLAQEVDGEVDLDYLPSGVVCNIAMPIPQRGGWMNNE